MSLAGLALICALVAPTLARMPQDSGEQDSERTKSTPVVIDPASAGCIACHAGIEAMHPEAELSCVDCHGGDGTATLKLEAHVAAPASTLADERTAPLDRNLAWRRFRNPMDLRVADMTCGGCHEDAVEHLLTSLHGTTAGHLSDGYYEMGLSKKRGSKYAVFPVKNAPVEGGEVSRLVQVPEFMDHLPETELATHFADLARKECMQCHLWSEGRAVRGRVGFDGDYRGDGCAACHVAYGIDGLSESGDRKRVFGEPGHPLRHEMTRAPTTQTCTTCHYGDASIGLHYRGLSQLPPNAPGGPNIPGTTDAPLNRVFYMNDPAVVPPDVHHERGMHCIDCHTVGDVMGDGRLHGQMEHAVEISCEACHGSFDAPATLRTERGTPLEHLRRDGDVVVLTSKVDGKERVVKQAAHVVDPNRPEYSPSASRAMTDAHGKLECYTCHAAWNTNFLGFHFSRIESLTQLDLLSGKRTPGRVTTQEKVFATWRSLYAGWNERGAIAPYLTGFSTMGSVWDANGELVLDQVMPVTAAGLSGMTMVHHQLHTTRPTARSCVECHRTSATWGMGSGNFELGRQIGFVADRRGIEVIGLQRSELARSTPLLKIPLSDVVALAAHCDPLQGRAHHLYAAEGGRGVHVFDVSNPLAPKRVAFVATINPRGLELAGDFLYVADGIGGLRIFDVSDPARIHPVGQLPSFDAHDVDIQWPWAYLADGPGGFSIIDVRAPIKPTLIASVDINGKNREANRATCVETLFQYSRPVAYEGAPQDHRTRARNLAAVLDERFGLVLIDATEPTRPQLLYPREVEERSRSRGNASYRGLALLSQVDPADAGGGDRTAERDYAYVLVETGQPTNRRSRVRLIDVTDPTVVETRPRETKTVPAGYATEQILAADFYNPPFRQRVVFTPGELGVYVADLSTSRDPSQVGSIPGLLEAYVMEVETFPLDRMIDASGARLKDMSRDRSRWMYRAEIERVLDVSADELGTDVIYEAPTEIYGITARLHLERADIDRTGMLEGDEYAEAGGLGVDDNRDGRIALIELARHAGLLGDTTSDDVRQERVEAADEMIAARVFRDGDLARLLDGTNPFDFDEDKSSGLDRRETDRALFAALDLDADGGLTRDELSRYPGNLRQLRYGDAQAERTFRAFDKTPDGRITRREFRIEDPEWLALDADQDGEVRLIEGRFEFERERGFARDGSEWPTRREFFLPLPPGLLSDRLLERFDADEDGTLSRAELGARPEVFVLLDRDRDGTGSPEEIARFVAQITRNGVDACPDDFLGRWDLDASGVIEEDELPSLVRLRLRKHLPRR